jgi:uncharacterized Zn-finger protein
MGTRMAANSIPYFHNNPGAPRVRIRAKEFMCVGDLPPFDHPHVYIDMGDDVEITCPYCATLFAYEPHLKKACEPAECELRPERVPELARQANDISVVTAPPRPELIAPAQPLTSAGAAMGLEATSAGLAASFATEEDMHGALRHLQAARGIEIQTYTPKALDGRSQRSPVPFAMLAAGLVGFGGTFAMETLANISSYPLDIGGRPKFSWPSFVPIAFEVGVLCAMLGGFFGYLIAARMPRLYDEADKFELMRGAMLDRWVITIGAPNGETLEQARKLLENPEMNGETPA